MFDYIRNHQMNIMLCFCAVSAAMTVMLFLTKFLSKKRKWILISIETVATLLLFFDRLAYIYEGDMSTAGYVMIRLSNFFVFFLTCAIVFFFNFYIVDLLENEGKRKIASRRLMVTGFIAIVGMLMVIISAFTGFYYYFDAQNNYHRGPGFIFCYLVPVLCPVIQYTAIFQYRKYISRFIYTALSLYIFLPMVTGIIQIFAYGISIVNMTLVMVSIFLYFFNYLDINEAVDNAHKIEIQIYKEKQNNMKEIFRLAATAFSKVQGSSERVAQLSRELAQLAGKSDEECDRVYYAAFLCDAGPNALSHIKQYPFLSESAMYVGKPYSEDIPDYSRIITVAKDYDSMINNPSIPPYFVRDCLLREAGRKYDPDYSRLMVQILDRETKKGTFDKKEKEVETEVSCKNYREKVTGGIELTQNVTDITFECLPLDKEKSFSMPSIILFDSFDKQVQNTRESINANKYLEYCEIWFDGHFISTNARNMESRNVVALTGADSSSYEIIASRYEDHLLLKLQSSKKSFEVIVALPSASKSAYIGITGENVNITNINYMQTGQRILENDIPRIAEKLNYIDRIESDIPNVQIVKPLSEFTRGVEVKDNLKLYFHTQSLPDANLIWHCPCIILYYSDDKEVFGKNYREYAVIKFDGETNGSNDFSDNSFFMKKTESFKNWEEWEAQNKVGYECQIDFSKKGNEITFSTQNKGLYIQNTSKVKDGNKEIYIALSGDQVAITDIRIR